MSTTETNANNNGSQTLFRFVSLRNPQLTETEPLKNLGFIHKPKDLDILFAQAIPEGIWNSTNGSKIEALESRISVIESQNSNYFYKTEKEIQTDFNDYFAAAERIARNQLENIADYLPPLSASVEGRGNNLYPSNYAKLWDNLIYQVLTQKDFYVKEAVLQIIKAIHFNIYQNSNSHSELRDAKVVLPGRLFVDSIIDDGVNTEDAPNVFTVNESLISNSYIAEDPNFSKVSASAERRLASYAQKNTELALSISKKSRIEELKSEIEMISKNYQREYSNALTQAENTHQTAIQPLMEDYEARLQRVRDTFTAGQTLEEQQALLDAVAPPVLPNFQFNYQALDTEYLKEKLSQKSFETMADVLHEEYVGDYGTVQDGVTYKALAAVDTERTLPVEGVFTKEELSTILDRQGSEYARKIITTTEVPQQEYANIAGALVPVQSTTSQNPFSAVLTPKVNIGGVYDFDLAIEVPDYSWELEAVECELKDSNGAIQKYSPKEFAVDGTKLLVHNIFNDQFSKTELDSFTEFTANVYFKNNREGKLTFKINNPPAENYFAKIVLSQGGTGKKAFNPKNFGIKRLGVADYLKVVQSVHAYVPGEVSNIENVMASELRHKSISERTLTEDTVTTAKSQEVEKMTDTSKVNRSEMQSEVAKELDRQQDFQAHANFNKEAVWKIDIGSSYANHNAKHESTRQATIKAQEITERALERVVSKISEERIQKIVHEVQLQNVHEFDNRGKIGGESPKHITGVYRWVDKKMKNQIYNYGKRTMFEFMIPEPARLHRLALKKERLTPPIDPRTVVGLKQMKDANAEEETLQYWADYYKVKLTDMLSKYTDYSVDTGSINLNNSAAPQSLNLVIPDNYKAYKAEIVYAFYNRFKKNQTYLTFDNLKGKNIPVYSDGTEKWTNNTYISEGIDIVGNYNMIYSGVNGLTDMKLIVNLKCTLSNEYIASWKKSAFDLIIAEYDKQYADFQKAQADMDAATKTEEANSKDKIGTFYRDMEEVVLKHNCIAYLLQDYSGIGKALTTDDNQTMASFSVIIDENLDAYTSLAKFLEQAFEWNVMDYTFYPYYWAESKHWKEMYLSEELDPLFRSFLQAGMARVVVTVKPGFEDAVNFYMATGKIWNGGEVPVIGDPMFLSIADELKAPVGKPQGKYWITTIPTSLTILQAKSVGLNVKENEALPIFPETDVDNCENPEELVTESTFRLEDMTMISTPGIGSTIPTEITNVFNESINV